ncbi:hypothetical protein NECAME_07362 [Necator americanus]|uniref:Uncharacterized protein n=1 Tax=Necator americanus TaxID=51031 RepID=W2TN60_NECAM|nr:hypothetical protein NECAME_07362 [Necator americanus]ETN83540.1 hypothetical protein NECAME_07362 [Necator americanus]
MFVADVVHVGIFPKAENRSEELPVDDVGEYEWHYCSGLGQCLFPAYDSAEMILLSTSVSAKH